MLAVFTFPWFAGFLNSYAVTLVKCITNIFGTEHEVHYNFKHFLTYVIFILAPLVLLVEVALINHGMKHFDMSKVMPINKGAVVINNVICGGVIFREFDNYEDN